MRDTISQLTLKLTLGRVEELGEALDGAMSAAPTRGQLPRRQRHRHRHRRHHARQRNNNHHHHVYQCQYAPNECQQRLHDDLDDQTKHLNHEPEPPEKRPKVNPIFLWALQREQRIIEVRCEDYDKRNRIKLTKTPHGWRSIPRTSSNVYNSCCCSRSNFFPKDANKASSSSPSVSSSCVPCSMSCKSASSSPCSSSESGLFSTMKGIKQEIGKGKNPLKRRIQVSDDESDTRTSSCRTSGRSLDLSGEDDAQVDDPDVDTEEEARDFDEYAFVDEAESNSRFLSCRRTFRLIDLEKAQKNQLLQPRVVLEPLNPSRLRLNGACERKKVDDDIEMVVEDENKVKLPEKNNPNVVNEVKEFVTEENCTKGDDTDEEIEEIEDKDDIEELDDENATVFEYDDRDSTEMMDESEIQERQDVMDSNDVHIGTQDTIAGVTQHKETYEPVNIQQNCREKDIIEEKLSKRPKFSGNILQVPDLKPINNNSVEQIPVISRKTCPERLLPSPPCSVTCSEDASKPETIQAPLNSSSVSLNRRKRETPELIEVKPTEWRRKELLRPAQQLRELIKKSGLLIPDPLLVPRNRLPTLAANPGTEIPELLASRPELRLPEALSRPELLADPDLLVISLAHLQKVLDAVPETRNRVESRSRLDPAEDTVVATEDTSESKRLACKPIGSLMPAPMDLSRRAAAPRVQDSILRVRNGLLKQESEVTSTARLPGDDSRLWHPLFGCRQKPQDKLPRAKLTPQPPERHHQHPQNYQQQPQDPGQQHRASWHRTTLAS